MTWLPATEMQRIRMIAERTELSVSKVVRKLLAKQANGQA